METKNYIKLLLVSVLMLATTALWAGSVTFNVTNSTGGPVSGVAIAYNDYGNHYLTLGTTDAGGQLVSTLPDGTYKFRALLLGHSSQYVDGATVPGTVNFQTSEFIMHVMKTDGTDFPGINTYWQDYTNHWVLVGATDANGKTSIELFPGTYNFRAYKDHTNQFGSLTVSTSGSSGTVDFQTATFIMHVMKSDGSDFQGIKAYYGDYTNHWLYMGLTAADGTASIELFPGTYNFRAYKDHTNQFGSLTVGSSGSSGTVDFQTSAFITHVMKSDGSDFDGIKTYFYDYNNHWLLIGTTGSDGTASIELFPGTYDFRAYKDHTNQVESLSIGSSGTSATVDFQTAKATGIVKDCDTGNPIEGISVYFYDYNNHWLKFGTTGTDGTASIELFPGSNYQFRAYTNHTSEVKTMTTLSYPGTSIEFNPTRLDFHYSGTVRFNDYSNHWMVITEGTYLFPGTYNFRFDDYQTTIDISGCVMDKSAVLVELLDSNGDGIAGGVAKYYKSGWKTLGTTDANGQIFALLDGTFGSTTFKMYYAGAGQSKSQNLANDSKVVFNTVLVTMKLLDTGGNELSGTSKYYASGWKTFGGGTTTTTMEMLPVNYTFKVYYGGSGIQKTQNVGTDPMVVFNTVTVTMKLLDSNGSELAGTSKYYASGWKTFGSGTTTTTMEMLPVKYTFKVYYGGAGIQKTQNVGTDPVVVFNTVTVTMKLLDSNGSELAGTSKYYASGWKTFGSGTTTTTMEMLPVKYTFKVYYGGAGIQKTQNVGTDPVVVFNTIPVTMKLLASDGTTELAGTSKYYASGWKTFGSGTTTTTMEMLPVNYTFKVYYGGAGIQKSQNVGTDPVVVFNTIPVTMKLLASDGTTELAGTSKYYASGWKTFGGGTTTTTMEMLPVNYTFKVYYGGAGIQKSQNVATDPVVVFNTITVTMKLLDSGGNELAGTSKYYASGWKTFGSGTTTTTMEMLPVNYTFKVYYGGKGMQKSQNVSVDPVVIFTGTAVTLHFTGDIKYYASGWKTFTKPTMNLLPGTYTFKFSGSGYPAYQTTLTVEGSEMEKSIAYIRLINSSGNPLAGGEAKYNKGGWQSVGLTNAQGIAFAMIDGSVGILDYRMYWEGSYVHKYQNLNTNSFVIFQTTNVMMDLYASDGTTALTGEGKVNSGGWKSMGNTPGASMELLPKLYDFRIYYAGSYIHKYQDVGNNSNVVFQTANVTMDLYASDGTTALTGEGKVNSGGWKSMGNTPGASMELLPKLYDFRIYYAGSYIHKYQDVGSNTNVVFQTTNVRMDLYASDGTTALTGEGKVNSSGWKSMGNTPGASMELLPKLYDFRIYYAGSYIHKYQDVASNTNVVFQTVLVETTLVDGSGNDISGGEGKVNSGGWKSLGYTPNATMELLPKTYDFRMYYSGTYTHKYQDVTSNQTVEFVWDGGFKSALITPDYITEFTNAYPNPFRDAVNLTFSIEKDQKVIVAVYDMRGALVKTLASRNMPAGDHKIIWDSKDKNGGMVNQGVYIVRFITTNKVEQKTIVKMR